MHEWLTTRGGSDVLRMVVKQVNKPGMAFYTTFGTINGKPCHWGPKGQYRMDGQPSEFDLPVQAIELFAK
jgi:hypothetical protein